jgi:hypothetical protein
VVVGGPAGVAGVPAGFSRDGVVSASGGAGSGSGLGTAGTIGAVLGGAALAGIAIAAATTGGDDGVTTTTLLPGPVPSPSAVPSATTYAGSFTGQRTISGISGPPGCESTTSTLTGTIRITLDTGGAGVAGTAVTMGVGTVAGNTGTCVTVGTRVGDTTPLNWNVPVSGTITNVVFTGVTDGGNGVTETVEFAGTLTGPSIAGTVTFTHRGGPGRFGAVTIPVTLR